MMAITSKSSAAALLLAAMLLALPLAGCANKKNQERAPSRPDAQQRREQAEDKFDRVSEPPLNAETRFAAGQLAESQGDFERAIAQYREALKLEPNHKPTLFRLGLTYTQAKRHGDAIAIWQRYVQVTNNASEAYNNLAFCYEQAGKLEEAEQTYKAGISRNPDDPSCRINYGHMLARTGRLDAAIAQLQTVLRPAEVHYNLGSVHEQMGKTEEAKAYYLRALELDPKLPDARARLARLK